MCNHCSPGSRDAFHDRGDGQHDWKSGRWHLRPALNLMLRSARLNDYYYGVRADEATAVRPAYLPGAGSDAWLGLHGYYDLSRGWRMLGNVNAGSNYIYVEWKMQ